MAQEAQSQSASLAGTLDDAGDVGHDKRLLATIGDDAQVGLERGEGVVGYLGLGGADDAEQGGFSRIGKSHESYVGQQFQLQDDGLLDACFAWLGKTGRLAGSGLEVLVAQATTSATQQAHDLPVLGHVTQKLSRLGIIHSGAAGHLDGAVLAVLACALVLTAGLAVGSEHVALILEVDKRPQVAVPLQEDVPATAAVAAVGTPLGYILGAVQVGRSSAAFTAAAQDFHVVNEVAFCHNCLYCGCKGTVF